jgi:hypothetical protein
VTRDTDAQPMLVFENIGCEPPVAYEDELIDRAIDPDRVRLDRAGRFPTGAPDPGRGASWPRRLLAEAPLVI